MAGKAPMSEVRIQQPGKVLIDVYVNVNHSRNGLISVNSQNKNKTGWVKPGVLQLLRPNDFGKGFVKSSQRQMTRLAGDFQNRIGRKPEAGFLGFFRKPIKAAATVLTSCTTRLAAPAAVPTQPKSGLRLGLTPLDEPSRFQRYR
jgi:hypothetical protein